MKLLRKIDTRFILRHSVEWGCSYNLEPGMG